MQQKHIILICYPAYGHIIPLLEFSKKLSRYHEVTFAVSQCKIATMKQREMLPDEKCCRFQTFGIEDQVCENTDQPENPNIRTKIMPAIEKLIADLPTTKALAFSPELHNIRPVDVVIADMMVAGAVSGCEKRGIPYYIFNPAAMTFLYTALITPEDCPTIALEDQECFLKVRSRCSPHQPIPDSWKQWALEIRDSVLKANGAILNSFRELERDDLQVLEQDPMTKSLPFYCVGPLLPKIDLDPLGTSKLSQIIANWLDGHSRKSVVYVSFGTITFPEPQQILELGFALLALGKPFIWSLPTKFHAHLPPELRKMNPDNENRLNGYSEITGSLHRQTLILPWAPQKLILSHPSSAVFVSHCGWNSTLETATCGVPVVAWPMFADQLTNADWLVKYGMAVLIPGTGALLKEKRIVSKSEIFTAIRIIGGWDYGVTVPNSFQMAAGNISAKLATAHESNGTSTKEFLNLIRF